MQKVCFSPFILILFRGLTALILVLSVQAYEPLFAQFFEDFNDGNLGEAPEWLGDTSLFNISFSSAIPEHLRPGLQLDAAEAGIVHIATRLDPLADMEWSFWAKQSFNSSANNYSRVYLISDQPDLDLPLNGLFLQLGGPSDSLVFYRQTDDSLMILGRGQHAYFGEGTNARFIRVTHTDGNWLVTSREDEGGAWLVECEAPGSVTPTGQYFGLTCQFTSSNTRKFYFDRIYAGPLIIDTVPPAITYIQCVDTRILRVNFSERTDTSIALLPAHYLLKDQQLHPDSVIPGAPAEHYVDLCFGSDLVRDKGYRLFISSITDLHGNMMADTTVDFVFLLPAAGDVVINEIMADPTPVLGLPAAEYIELFNPSENSISLDGWHLRCGNTSHPLAGNLNSGDFLLICGTGHEEEFSGFGPVQPVTSFSLTNSGEQLRLTDARGRFVHGVAYSDDWYGDTEKSEGGWSLEQIDPENPCPGKENWSASYHPLGGTPGAENSILNENIIFPLPASVCILGNDIIQVNFNQSIDSATLADPTVFTVEGGHGHPEFSTPLAPAFFSVSMKFRDPFMPGTIYSLLISDLLVNCNGMSGGQAWGFDFGIPVQPDSADIIINEVLFNPVGNGADYVELFNRSDKVIDLTSLFLGTITYDQDGHPDTLSKEITEECSQLLPGEYVLLTTDRENILFQYPERDEGAFLEMPAFPSLPNESGNVLILDRRERVYDAFHYQEEMHYPLLFSNEGVSLEKVSPELPAFIPGNWASASELSGFGTPGIINSQFVSAHTAEEPVTIFPAVFSPDGDGLNDLMGISYRLAQGSGMVTISIYHRSGQRIRLLVNNDLAGTSGTYFWDGTDDDHRLVIPGYYIISFMVFHTDGQRDHYRKVCGLVR